MAKWQFSEWLLFWLLETQYYQFEWDRGNQTKNKNKHGISITDTEEVFRSGVALPLGIQILPPTTEQRLGVVGPTFGGLLLQVVFVLRAGRVRVISARRASRKERNHYEKILRQITEGI
ncbi:MAG: BrnT family toxin [Deltaproteobacteria bacterium]|nr:BrnT family toxin [Deltaproteobacteria bacterium]